MFCVRAPSFVNGSPVAEFAYFPVPTARSNSGIVPLQGSACVHARKHGPFPPDLIGIGCKALECAIDFLLFGLFSSILRCQPGSRM